MLSGITLFLKIAGFAVLALLGVFIGYSIYGAVSPKKKKEKSNKKEIEIDKFSPDFGRKRTPAYMDVFQSIGLVFEFDLVKEKVWTDRSDMSGRVRDEVVKVKEKQRIEPELQFNSDGSFTLTVHEKVKQIALNNGDFLLSELHKRDPKYFPVSKLGYCEQLSFRNNAMIKVQYFPMGPAVKEKMKERHILEEAGLVSEDATGEKIYPKIEFRDGALFIETRGSLLTKADIEKSLTVLRVAFDKPFSFVVKTNTGYKILITSPADLKFKFRPEAPGNSLFLDNIEPLNELKKKIEDRYEKTKRVDWWFGELNDGSLKLNNPDLFVAQDTLPAILVAGSQGSGKTQTCISLISALSYLYQGLVKIETVIMVGTATVDWDVVAKYTSPLPVAKPVDGTGDDRLIQFRFAVDWITAEANRRAKEFESKNTPDITEYRRAGYKMSELIVIIDEWAEICKMVDAKNNIQTDGTIAGDIKRIPAVFRKYGIRLIVATQDTRASSVPKELMNVLPARLIHKVVADDIKFMESLGVSFGHFDPTSFKQGDYIVTGLPETECVVTGTRVLPLRMPYAGSTASKDQLLNMTNGLPRVHIPYDEDTIVSEGKISFDSLSPSNQFKTLKAALKWGGFNVELKVDNMDYIPNVNVCAVMTHPDFKREDGTLKAIGFGLLTKEDIHGQTLEKLAEEEIEADLYVFFMTDKTDARKALKDGNIPPNFVFLHLVEYQKEMKLELLEKKLGKPSTGFFTKIVNNGFNKIREAEELTNGIGLAPGSSVPAHLQGNTQPQKIRIDVGDISPATLEKIINLPANTDQQRKIKGDAGELFVANVFRKLGFKAERTADIIRRGEVVIAGGMGDQKTDIILTTPDNRRIAVQVKTWKNQPVDNGVISDTKGTLGFWKCEQGWVITCSSFTAPAEQLAKAEGVKLFRKHDLLQFIEGARKVMEAKKEESITSENKPSFPSSQKERPGLPPEARERFLSKIREKMRPEFKNDLNGKIDASSEVKTPTVSPETEKQEEAGNITETQEEVKRRGRPRKHPLPDPNSPKRGRGRPKKTNEETSFITEKALAEADEEKSSVVSGTYNENEVKDYDDDN